MGTKARSTHKSTFSFTTHTAQISELHGSAAGKNLKRGQFICRKPPISNIYVFSPHCPHMNPYQRQRSPVHSYLRDPLRLYVPHPPLLNMNLGWIFFLRCIDWGNYFYFL